MAELWFSIPRRRGPRSQPPAPTLNFLDRNTKGNGSLISFYFVYVTTEERRLLEKRKTSRTQDPQEPRSFQEGYHYYLSFFQLFA